VRRKSEKYATKTSSELYKGFKKKVGITFGKGMIVDYEHQ